MNADRTTSISSRLRAFTIIELLVVMGVIGVLALLTTLGARKLTQGSRLAAATNAVTSALGNARAAAIKDSAVTAVVFRPVIDPAKPQIPQHVEIVTVRSTRERRAFGGTALGSRMEDAFRPVAGIPVVALPEGIKVAAPMYEPSGGLGDVSTDNAFTTQCELVAAQTCSEALDYNRAIAVMFGPDGQFITRAPGSSVADNKCYVDWYPDGVQAVSYQQPSPLPPAGFALGSCSQTLTEMFWWPNGLDDECNLMFVPVLSVYDDKGARVLKTTDWGNPANILAELTGPNGYIAQFGDRITFNRFSGIPERKLR